MTRTDTELAVIAAVASTSTLHPVLFGQRLTLTIKYTSGAQPAATPRTITVRVRTTVHMPLFADIWASTGPAVAGVAAVVAGWVRKIATKVTNGLERALTGPLAAGPALCPALVTEREAAGLARGRVDRQVAGASTGWSQRLPEASGPPLMVAGVGVNRRGR